MMGWESKGFQDCQNIVAKIKREMHYGQVYRLTNGDWYGIVPSPYTIAVLGMDPSIRRSPHWWWKYFLNGVEKEGYDPREPQAKMGPYKISMYHEVSDPYMEIRLPVELCPKCHGRGRYYTMKSPSVMNCQPYLVVEHEIVECNHVKEG